MFSQASNPPSQEAGFNVFIVRDGPVMDDPDTPGTRYHTVIFVETGSDGSGIIHHVDGDLVIGMRYETKQSRPPEESETFHNKEFIGTVSKSSYPLLDAVCRSQPPPPRQKAFNIRTMRTEPVKPDGTFYSQHDSRPRLIKCTEWTQEQAVPALLQARVVEPTQPVTL